MDENLIGYLLKALDADEHRAVEMQLREQPEDQKRVEELRRRLDLLACDAVESDPPEELWVKALATVAEYKCRSLPYAPSPTPGQTITGRVWWRRVDVLVAAVLLLVVGGLGAMALLFMRDQQNRITCQGNLRNLFNALYAYSENDPTGSFPQIVRDPPGNVAGFFIPTLKDAGVLPTNVTVACPAAEGWRDPPNYTREKLKEIYDTDDQDKRRFRDVARNLSGCYAYSLGYEVAIPMRQHRGLTNKMDGTLPLLADAPPSAGTPDFLLANSPNHGGRGQNVLYISGNVEFRASRAAGLDGDDIYLNNRNLVGAGLGPRDTVLGRSDATPYPTDN